MYALLGIDTILRIGAAMLVLFVVIPALAWPRPRDFSRLEWFWWCFGTGIVVLTLAGQLFTLLNVAGPFTYLALFAAIVIVCRARRKRVGPLQYIVSVYRLTVLASLKILDGRISVRRRLRRAMQRRSLRAPSLVMLTVAAVAAILRFYRPFATANLGFSDTYVHLYLMRLLDQGRQVDPAWGPYPRGMHFLLLAIQRLTNVDTILLMNFFGAAAGVLTAIAVAYTARRIAKNNVAALVAGLLFATMIGGPRQYFMLGGSVSATDAHTARTVLQRPYDELQDYGEYDALLTAFQRQTSTLPQELAIVLLFPAALFLLDWLRDRNPWRLWGYVMCTAAIAAIHSGVVVPLVLLCGVVVLAARPAVRDAVRAALFGAAGVALGSTWFLGFLRYRSVSATSRPGATALYYFPFLRPFAGGNSGDVTQLTAYLFVTPFLAAVLVIALIIAIRGRRDPGALFIALAVAVFSATHAAAVLGIPEVVEVRRNVSWLIMAIATLLGVAAVQIERRVVPAVVLGAWAFTIPNVFGAATRSRLIDYSGYGATTLAVVEITHRFQPFTWTLVSYGQEYPMVLGRGFHLNGIDFLEQFDPGETPLRIPTPYVFVVVEKRPHKFKINTWATRFDRGAVEERLATWCSVYRFTHRDMRIFLDDPNVRVYEIVKTQPRLAEAQP